MSRPVFSACLAVVLGCLLGCEVCLPLPFPLFLAAISVLGTVTLSVRPLNGNDPWTLAALAICAAAYAGPGVHVPGETAPATLFGVETELGERGTAKIGSAGTSKQRHLASEFSTLDVPRPDPPVLRTSAVDAPAVWAPAGDGPAQFDERRAWLDPPVMVGRWTSYWRGRARSLGRLEGSPQWVKGQRVHSHASRTAFVLSGGGVEENSWVALLSPGKQVYRTVGPDAGSDGAQPGTAQAPTRIEIDASAILRLRAPEQSILAAPTRILKGVRKAAMARLRSIEDVYARGLVSALVLGDRSELPRDFGDTLSRTGLRHLFALSGLHVGLLMLVLLWPLARLIAWGMDGLYSVLERGFRWVSMRRTGSEREGGVPSAAPFARTRTWLRNGQSRRALILALLLLALLPLTGTGAPVKRAALALALATLAPRLPAIFGTSARTPGSGEASRLARTPANSEEDAAQSWQQVPRFDPGRRPDGISLWSLALLFECALDPHALLNPGVQLSYAATLGLLLGAQGALDRLRSCLPAGGRIATTNSLGRRRADLWRVPLQRFYAFGQAGMAASVVAVLATLPIVWIRFGEFAPAGIPLTVLALPFVTGLIVLGLAFLSGLIPALWLLPVSHALNELVLLGDRLPGTPLQLPPRPGWLLAIACWAFVFALSRRGSRGSPSISGLDLSGQTGMEQDQSPTNPDQPKHWMGVLASSAGCARLGLLTMGLVVLPWAPEPRGLELVVLDVGHGTSALFRAPGEGCWIFDAGTGDRGNLGPETLGPLLRRWEVNSLSVVLSHADEDHCSALPWISARWPIDLWAGADPALAHVRGAHGPDETSWLKAREGPLSRGITRRLDVARGRMHLPTVGAGGGRLRLELLRGLEAEGNEGSRSLRVTYGDVSCLLCGDAEKEGLANQLSDSIIAGPLRMLLFPHHGSECALIGPLLDSCEAQEVWISAARPPPILEELARRGQPWRLTCKDGPLVLRIPAERPGSERKSMSNWHN